MLIGIAIYLTGRGYLPAETLIDRAAERPHLQRGDGWVIAALVGVIAITSLYWVGQTQVWNTYPIWLRDRVDRGVFDLTVPVTWFQSLDTLAVLALALVSRAAPAAVNAMMVGACYLALFAGGMVSGWLGRLYEVLSPAQNSLEGFLSAVAQRESPHQRGEKFRMEALGIEVLNQIAYVKAHCPMLGFNYFDYLALVHDGSRWLITNKLFTHATD